MTTVQQKLFLNGMENNPQAADEIRLALMAGKNINELVFVWTPNGVQLVEKTSNEKIRVANKSAT